MRGITSANGRMTRYFVRLKRQGRIDHRRCRDRARGQGGDARAETAGRDGFDLVGHLRFFQSQTQQDVARRFGSRVAGLFAGKVRHVADVGLRIGDQRDFADMTARRVDDDDIKSRAACRDRGGGRDFAVGKIAGEDIAQRRAAAGASDHLIDLDAGVVKIALFHGHGPGQRGGDASILADRELKGMRRRCERRYGRNDRCPNCLPLNHRRFSGPRGSGRNRYAHICSEYLELRFMMQEAHAQHAAP